MKAVSYKAKRASPDMFKYAADNQALYTAIREALDQLGRRPRSYDTIAVNNARSILDKAFSAHRRKYLRKGEEIPHG